MMPQQPNFWNPDQFTENIRTWHQRRPDRSPGDLVMQAVDNHITYLLGVVDEQQRRIHELVLEVEHLEEDARLCAVPKMERATCPTGQATIRESSDGH